jgi:hypothetical protein
MNAHLSTIRAAARTHARDVPDLICRFLAAATDSSEKYWKDLYWEETIDGFLQVQRTNAFAWQVPLVKTPDFHKEDQPAWIYTGGEWYFWWHTFASVYGWTEEYIANLEIEPAFAMMQEIMVADQLKKEWEHLLSGHAMIYDPSTGTSKPNPLPRPDWMKPSLKAPGKMKILRSMLPEGVVVDKMSQSVEIEIVEDK